MSSTKAKRDAARRLTSGDDRIAAIEEVREWLLGKLHSGTPRDLANVLIDKLIESRTVAGKFTGRRLSRTTAALLTDSDQNSSAFKAAVHKVAEELATCRPRNGVLMPDADRRTGVACLEAAIDGIPHLVFVRGPTSEHRDPSGDADDLLRLTAEFLPLGPSHPRHRWNVPYLRSSTFSGRTTLMKWLEDLETASGSPRIDVVVGLQGVGKTALCVEFAYRNRHSKNVVWWIRGNDRATVLADYRALAAELGILQFAGPAFDAATVVRDWLEANENWILIFDSVDSPDHIYDLLPRIGSGHVVITSVNHDWKDVTAVRELVSFSEPEALEFFQRRTVTDTADALLLAEDMGYLPLALEYAATYIEQTAIAYSAYREMYKRFRDRWFLEHEGHLSPIAAVWNITLTHVRRATPFAVELLQFASHLAAAPIPREVFDYWVEGPPASDRSEGPDIAWNARDTRSLADLADAIAALRRYSLVNVTETHIVMHRLLQEVVRLTAPKSARRGTGLAARMVVYDLLQQEYNHFHDSELVSELLPHAQFVAAAGGLSTTQLSVVIRLLIVLAGYQLVHHKFTDAISILTDADLRCRGHDLPAYQRLTVLTYLTQANRRAGNDADAYRALRRAAEIAATFQCSTTGEFAAYMHYVEERTTALANAGDVDTAVRELRSALDTIHRIECPRWLELKAHLHLGVALRRVGQLSEALRHLQIALKGTIADVGLRHPNVSSILAHMGWILLSARRFDEAHIVSGLAGWVQRSLARDDRPEAVTLLIQQATALLMLREYQPALACYDEALTIANANNLRDDLRALLHYDRAFVLTRLGRSNDAVADIALGAQLDPEVRLVSLLEKAHGLGFD